MGVQGRYSYMVVGMFYNLGALPGLVWALCGLALAFFRFAHFLP